MKTSRFLEIDLLRTIAILLMVAYHTAYDLQFFYAWNIDVLSGGWWLLARGTATLFLLLVGVSAAISASKTDDAPRRLYDRKVLRRFLRIGSAAMIVSGVTYVMDPTTYVRFGILHLIAVSTMLLPLLAPLKARLGILGLFILLLTPILQQTNLADPPLLVLGFPPTDFRSVDYFPLMPWFGVILIGYAVGWLVYVRGLIGQRRHNVTSQQQWITWPGRHALFLYLIHQPVIVGILWTLL